VERPPPQVIGPDGGRFDRIDVDCLPSQLGEKPWPYREYFAAVSLTESPGFERWRPTPKLLPDDIYPREDVFAPASSCRACGAALLPENRKTADGCSCNAPRGVNHGLVAKNTCTCVECDPAETGGTRIGKPPPVDHSARDVVGAAVAPGVADTTIGADGQQAGYVILSAAERAKGFVRPVRRSYVHVKCGAATKMSQEIAESYSRSPGMYSGTFCVSCKDHFPVGEDGEFVWDDGSKVGT